MYPDSPLPLWEKDKGQRRGRGSQFRFSQKTCLLYGGRPSVTPRMWGRGTRTHVDTICTWTHHPLKWSLPSHSGGSSGSSASRSWSGSGWESGCQKAQPGSSLFGS